MALAADRVTLTDRVAWVTGAAVGIGAAIVLLFSRKWRMIGHAIASCVLTASLIYAGIQLDAATLLYMT